ncbi:hypothetical protein PCASD_00215 [Puccinia coronata f. sp. avenae]|uniref:SHSP domain-containing protein n=1 Tax=Puccinia coronata f. sp. avenae TaxID=200324 RepID=A0A2N5VQP7_9BASI|nr:hypothetical protein PCASD_00215 [Puccinia coronata f. sp. avenae]
MPGPVAGAGGIMSGGPGAAAAVLSRYQQVPEVCGKYWKVIPLEKFPQSTLQLWRVLLKAGMTIRDYFLQENSIFFTKETPVFPKMSFLIAPGQWDDFEQLFDKLVTDRYGPPSDGSKGSHTESKALSTGSHPVSRVQRPKMDVVETDSSIVLTTELPGAKKEDISIDLQNGRLSISGQTKASSEHSKGSVRISERSFGSFSRSIAVPPGLTHDQVKAGFKDGVLEVTIPKPIPNKESQNIPIA